jgi:hypothetical protein
MKNARQEIEKSVCAIFAHTAAAGKTNISNADNAKL